MENNTSIEQGAASAENSAISLDISGSGLMLKGRFVDWESGVMMGPDLDQLQVRLAIDATSARIDSGESSQASLFSFRGRDATALAAGFYQVDGELDGALGTRAMQAQVETPIEHSAVFVLSFQANKSDFGANWTRLLSNVVPLGARLGTSGRGAERSSMPAYGWLTVPHLAAA